MFKRVKKSLRVSEGNYAEGGRVAWEVDGELLWLESDQVQLVPRNEAVGCLLFFLAMHLRKRVYLDGALCKKFQKSLPKIAEIWDGWWPDRRIRLKRFRSRPKSLFERKRAGKGVRIAQFFSLGVDSFHTLLECPDTDTLICVHGFDVPLSDGPLFERIKDEMSEVARAYGKDVIFIRTNLREHHLWAGSNWEHWFGCGLAAVAHCLPDEYGVVRIASSFHHSYDGPAGGFWTLDPLWSSRRLDIQHHGERSTRLEKVAVIKQDELVLRYLRVCWERKSLEGSMNCGRCEKCLRTLVALAVGGLPETLESFESDIDIAARLDSLEGLREHLIGFYENMLREGVDPDIDRAITRLLERSVGSE